MTEAAAFVLALGNGDTQRMLAWFQVAKVEINGVSGCSRTPA